MKLKQPKRNMRTIAKHSSTTLLFNFSQLRFFGGFKAVCNAHFSIGGFQCVPVILFFFPLQFVSIYLGIASNLRLLCVSLMFNVIERHTECERKIK